jgi:hypothetical protein
MTQPGGRDAYALHHQGWGHAVPNPRLTNLARVGLVGAAAFNAVSAIGGAIAIFLTDGLGMPRSLLAGSPFSTFLLPGALLLVVVGGTQVLAALLLFLRRPSALFWAALAGFTMVTWILIETAIIRGFSFLQAFYYLTGITELVLVLALLGIVGWMPRIDSSIERDATARRPRVPDEGVALRVNTTS